MFRGATVRILECGCWRQNHSALYVTVAHRQAFNLELGVVKVILAYVHAVGYSRAPFARLCTDPGFAASEAHRTPEGGGAARGSLRPNIYFWTVKFSPHAAMQVELVCPRRNGTMGRRHNVRRLAPRQRIARENIISFDNGNHSQGNNEGHTKPNQMYF